MFPPGGKLGQSKIEFLPEQVTIPTDGSDVREIDANLVKFEHKIPTGSNGDLKVRHRNVVHFIGACTRPPLLCIVTEYMRGGSIYDFLHKDHGVLKLPTMLKVALDVARGMSYLHQNNIIHRDKLLIDENEVVKFADFGVARVQTLSGVMTPETGTYRWIGSRGCSRREGQQKEKPWRALSAHGVLPLNRQESENTA
ncbi:hypothetical protein ACH5RR_027534 [Cinchona calisaya]|uniref:Protein kinase domain-containing protein n=1 Tax=Cinchona calisaya TaxID=153742 RepID=A0ABD2Z9M0_9GENT